jgi:hypothetical protein
MPRRIDRNTRFTKDKGCGRIEEEEARVTEPTSPFEESRNK